MFNRAQAAPLHLVCEQGVGRFFEGGKVMRITSAFGVAVGVVLLLASTQARANCYKNRHGVCLEDGASGYDSTCTNRCFVGLITDEQTHQRKRITIIYKDHIPDVIDTTR